MCARRSPHPKVLGHLIARGWRVGWITSVWGTTRSFLSPDSDKIRLCVDGLVGLIIHTFAVADAYAPAAELLLSASAVARQDAIQRRLQERIHQSQERYQRAFQTLVDELLLRTRHDHEPHFEEFLTRLHG